MANYEFATTSAHRRTIALHPLYCRRTGRAGLRQIRRDKIAKSSMQKLCISSTMKHRNWNRNQPELRESRRHSQNCWRLKQYLGCDGHCPAAFSMVSKHNSHDPRLRTSTDSRRKTKSTCEICLLAQSLYRSSSRLADVLRKRFPSGWIASGKTS